MNRNQPFVCEMAFHIVHLHRAGETDKALNLRKQPQGMTVDDEQLHRAVAQLYGLPDQSNEAMEEWVRSQYLADGRGKGYLSDDDDAAPLWLLAGKAHTYYGDLKPQAS